MSVFTPVSKQQLIGHLQQNYNIGELNHYEGIAAGVENSNFFVTTNQGEFVLTLFESHSIEKLSFYLGLMAHLAKADIPSIQAISSKHDKLLHTLNGKPASFIKRLRGTNPTEISQSHCTQIGEMLAKFHLSALSYPHQMENEFDLAWQKDIVGNWLHKMPSEDAALLQNELTHQLNIEDQIKQLPSGIIHGDLFRDNSLFVESQDDANQPTVKLSAILDLYTACNDTLLIDLAIVFNDWCFKSDGLDETLARSLLNAYQIVRPLTKQEKMQFNNILRAGALRFWVLRLDLKYNPRTSEKTSPNAYNPEEYKHKLRKHIADETNNMRLLSDV